MKNYGVDIRLRYTIDTEGRTVDLSNPNNYQWWFKKPIADAASTVEWYHEAEPTGVADLTFERLEFAGWEWHDRKQEMMPVYSWVQRGEPIRIAIGETGKIAEWLAQTIANLPPAPKVSAASDAPIGRYAGEVLRAFERAR